MYATTREKMIEISQKDTGALSVATQILQYINCDELLDWLIENNYIGSDLWILYKDVHKENIIYLHNYINIKIYDL